MRDATPIAPEKPDAKQKRQTALLGLLLALVTLGLYWPATTHDFSLLDDGLYVSDNPQVSRGLSLPGLKWAFTSAYASNWHPLTWISHMLDCSIYGLFPGGHHLTNILLHTLNTLLVFLMLRRMTKALWPSLIVAALFGWHPLHVESVAWVAERKDVLSTLFLLLTLGAYARYVAAASARDSRSSFYYCGALFLFALGLMSKPMLVTLPCLLLLLDYWPLCRAENSGLGGDSFTAPISWPKLIVEKIPFFVLALAACVVTVLAQRQGGAIRTVAEVPYGLRALNALGAYVFYLGKTVWPLNLCAYYLLPTNTPLVPAIIAGLALAGITWFAFHWRGQFPWLLVGWLWFLGTLVPVIGLVQVGSQAMADRYTYIPLIGLFIAIVWGIKQALGAGPTARTFGCGITVISLGLCLALTHHQLAFWHDNIALFQRVVAVTKDNYFGEYELGMALANAGRTAEAIEHHQAALGINPDYEPAQYQLGNEFATVGKLDDAAFQFSNALKRDPASQELHNNLGAVLAQQGRLEAASTQFQQAIQINPSYARAYLNYANTLQKLGQTGAAITNYNRARALDPGSAETLDKLALLLATCPDTQWQNPAEAIKLAENANDLTQQDRPAYLSTLATTYAAAGNFPKAITTAELALTKAQEQRLADLETKLKHDLESYRLSRMPN